MFLATHGLDGIIGCINKKGKVQACINEGMITGINGSADQICSNKHDGDMIIDCEEKGTVSKMN